MNGEEYAKHIKSEFENTSKNKHLYWIAPSGVFFKVIAVKKIDGCLCAVFADMGGYADLDNTEIGSFVFVASTIVDHE